MSENEKTIFGAVIEPPRTPLPPTVRDAPPSPLTTSLLPAHDTTNPFYNVDCGNRTSSDLKHPQYSAHDLETQRSNDFDLSRTESSRPACSSKNGAHDSMWPSLKTQKAQAKQQKCAKSWNPMARMGKRQKLIVTAVIALVIVGAAVGIGVGVSKAVGGGVRNGQGGTRPLGENGGPA